MSAAPATRSGIRVVGILAAFLAAGAIAGTAWNLLHGSVGAGGPPSFAAVVARAAPAVVSIRSTIQAGKPLTAGDPEGALAKSDRERNGSGFLIEPDGLIVTALHLTRDASRIEVEIPDFGEFPADLVGLDEFSDVALVRVRGAPARLPCLAWGDTGTLRPGDWVVALGNPFGYAETVTVGVVSSVGRHLPQFGFAATNFFLQFSAPVNPGSSGSPVLDPEGRVVGMTTQAATSGQGISFAVPTRTLRWAVPAMQQSQDGRIRRGYLGIEFSIPQVQSGSSQVPGCVIRKVQPGEAAERAGLCVHDTLLAVDGVPIRTELDLLERVSRTPPGTEIHLTVLRDGRQREIQVALRELTLRPEPKEKP